MGEGDDTMMERAGALAVENEALRQEIAELRAENAALRASNSTLRTACVGIEALVRDGLAQAAVRPARPVGTPLAG